jgi:hypothetical protein
MTVAPHQAVSGESVQRHSNGLIVNLGGVRALDVGLNWSGFGALLAGSLQAIKDNVPNTGHGQFGGLALDFERFGRFRSRGRPRFPE